MVADMTNRLFEEQLNVLRTAYVADLQRTLGQLQAYSERLQSEQSDNELFKNLQRTVHGLAGSGATYGFASLSEVAGRLDRYLGALNETGAPPNSDQKVYILALLADLHVTIVTLSNREQNKLPVIATPAASQALTPLPIVIYDSDSAVAEDIGRQISNFGYTVALQHDLKALIAVMRLQAPAAVIADLALLEDAKQFSGLLGNTPLIVTASQDDFATRLRAVRAGGAAFFTKPIDTSALVDTLDSLTSQDEVNPYRILIIDDQPLLAATYAVTLRQAGMLVSSVTNPLRIMSALVEFHPDVLLLDMYMPGCTGIELATVLRQQTAYEGIPIVFLSAETQLDRQMDALKRGGDDFLTKPIELDHLTAAVSNRAQRARKMRAAMIRDSLTGLYNHTTTKEHLKREITRASRQGQTFTFAMIDLDRFKQINDTYGHIVGDHVIKSLARLLKQRLRKSDVVGRFGGEEFALILPDTDEQTALKLIDELRQRFARVRQYAGGTTFNTTFSCGLTSYPRSADQASLIASADRALYEAKRSGRNRVVSTMAEYK